MVRKVTAKQDECVIVTTGALVTSSVTDNINNSCLSEFGPHIWPSTFDKEKDRRRGEARQLLDNIQGQHESECTMLHI